MDLRHLHFPFPPCLRKCCELRAVSRELVALQPGSQTTDATFIIPRAASKPLRVMYELRVFVYVYILYSQPRGRRVS